VAASISASSPIFKFHAIGIIDDQSMLGQSHMACNDGNINHAVTIVGWGRDDDFERDYFIIKNSFGTDWGDSGYAKIAMTNSNDLPAGSCSILASVWATPESLIKNY
jgi:C1A family cysteine protease